MSQISTIHLYQTRKKRIFFEIISLTRLNKNNLNKEDVATIQNLSRLLGQTDIEGQISEVEVVNNFLTVQLENASEERRKNEKMYRTLGLVTGLTIAIILI